MLCFGLHSDAKLAELLVHRSRGPPVGAAPACFSPWGAQLSEAGKPASLISEVCHLTKSLGQTAVVGPDGARTTPDRAWGRPNLEGREALGTEDGPAWPLHRERASMNRPRQIKPEACCS